MVPKDDQVPYHSESPPLLIDACFEIIVSSSASGLSKLLGFFHRVCQHDYNMQFRIIAGSGSQSRPTETSISFSSISLKVERCLKLWHGLVWCAGLNIMANTIEVRAKRYYSLI